MVLGLLAFTLDSDPRFELPDGFALRRELDVGIDGVYVFTRGMTHEGFPHVRHDASFHEPGVEGMAKIVETEGANLGTADGCLPGSFDFVQRTAFKGENQSVGLGLSREQIDEPRGERDLASFALSGFRVGHGEHPAIEVNVLTALGQKLTQPHARIERYKNDGVKVGRGGFEELVLFRQAHDGTGFASLAHHGNAGNGVGHEESLVNRVIKKMPEHFDIAVEGGLREPFFAMSPGAVAPHQGLRDTTDLVIGEVRQ